MLSGAEVRCCAASGGRWEEGADAGSVGPDSSTTLIKHVKAKRQFHFEMRFHASVLHMRGTDVTPQPFTADNGDVLLFNGEIFDGLEVSWCSRTRLIRS